MNLHTTKTSFFHSHTFFLFHHDFFVFVTAFSINSGVRAERRFSMLNHAKEKFRQKSIKIYENISLTYFFQDMIMMFKALYLTFGILQNTFFQQWIKYSFFFFMLDKDKED